MLAGELGSFETQPIGSCDPEGYRRAAHSREARRRFSGGEDGPRVRVGGCV
jgi:hypothetical protein